MSLDQKALEQTSSEQMSLLQKFVTQKNYQADKKVRKKEKGKRQSGLLYFQHSD